MTGLLAAIQFLTRIPVRLAAPVPHERVVPWFPVVGAGIGTVVGSSAWAMGQVVAMPVAAAVAVTVGLLVTGAFHEDALADVADAFGGGWTVEQRLEILKDPRHGTYGVAALVASVAIRMLAAAVLLPDVALAAFVAAHALGRTAAVAVMATTPPASAGGLGADHATHLDAGRTLAGSGVGVLTAVAVVVATFGAVDDALVALVPMLVVAVMGAVAVARLARAKIGGHTGDVLGATEQVVECLVLVAAAAA